jgi:hypothetical protein
MWALSRDDVPTRLLQKINSKKSMFTTFSAARNLHPLILSQKARIWIITISAALFEKGSEPALLLEHEKRL